MLLTLLNKRDLYMAPNSIGAFLFKHQREKVKDPQAMITISNHFTSCPKLRVMISFTSQQLKHLSEKEMCQKSKIDTTIDFVKHPKYSRINAFLNIFFVPKTIWNRGIITLVDQAI